jgi:hypothetical protein
MSTMPLRATGTRLRQVIDEERHANHNDLNNENDHDDAAHHGSE